MATTEPFVVAVNGQLARIEEDPATPVASVIPDAILLTGNERWGGVEQWECRNPRGELLDGSVALGGLVPNERGVCVFVQLKPGVGA